MTRIQNWRYQIDVDIQADIDRTRLLIGDWDAPHLDRYSGLCMDFMTSNGRLPYMAEREALLDQAKSFFEGI